MYGRGSQPIGFGPPVTPTIVKQLIIANVAMFVGQLAFGFTNLLAVRPAMVWQGGYLWQPFTYMWLHSPNQIFHILMNMFVLWMFGSQLALVWGAKRFLRYYLVCGIGAGFIISLWPYLAVALGLTTPMALLAPTVGASGAIYGVMLAYSLTWPDRTIMLIFPPVAFRAIWLIPILFGLTFFMDPTGRISHAGHLGGVLVGWLYLRWKGEAGHTLSLASLKHRWRRYRMRRKLRAIRYEDFEARRKKSNDRTLH